MTWTYLAIGFAAGCAWYTTVDQVFNWLEQARSAAPGRWG